MTEDVSMGDQETRPPDDINRPATDADQALAPNERIGQYRILRVLGQGGMGRVYEAENVVNGRRGALKTLLAPSAGPAFVERFRIESRVMMDLLHPNIVKVLHAGEERGIHYLVMDLVVGTGGSPATLEALLRPAPTPDIGEDVTLAGTGDAAIADRTRRQAAHIRLPESTVRSLALMICDALDYAHRRGVIHRDLKPANILLAPPDDADRDSGLKRTRTEGPQFGVPRITDFGLAKVFEQGQTANAETAGGRSLGDMPTRGNRAPQDLSMGGALGTFGYMAPEQRAGRPVTPRADLYALGVILYRMLTGTRPEGRFRLPSAHGCARGWDRVINRCLASDPADRYASATELARDIRKTDRTRTRRRNAAIAAAGIGIAAAGAMAYHRLSASPGGQEVADAAGLKPDSRTPDTPEIWENSLGMQFVPVPGTDVLFSIHETRNRDFRMFRSDHSSGWFYDDGVQRLPDEQDRIAREKGLSLDEDDQPVVRVTWSDAVEFCAWLTEKERREGRIRGHEEYRLPRDWEWSVAVGLNEDRDLPIETKHNQFPGIFPWGRSPTAPPGSGNFAGTEVAIAAYAEVYHPNLPQHHYRDEHPVTAPVGSYAPNPFGLYDLGGNVREFCADHVVLKDFLRVVARGACWRTVMINNARRASHRHFLHPRTRLDNLGFRIVLAQAEENALTAASLRP